MKVLAFVVAFMLGLGLAACGSHGFSSSTSCGKGLGPRTIALPTGVYLSVGLDPRRPPMPFGAKAEAVVGERSVELSFRPPSREARVRLDYVVTGKRIGR